MKKIVKVIACGAIAREIMAVCERNQLGHIDMVCLPAKYHLHPDKIAGAVEKKILQAREEGCDSIFIAYGDCGTGGELDKVCKKYGVERIPGPHCYSFLMGNDRFEERFGDDISTFYLTDFLARQFNAFVIKPLGLDRHPELKDMYFSHYTKLVYLVQEEDEELERRAREAAHFLGLEYERHFTGYGELATDLKSIAS